MFAGGIPVSGKFQRRKRNKRSVNSGRFLLMDDLILFFFDAYGKLKLPKY